MAVVGIKDNVAARLDDYCKENNKNKTRVVTAAIKSYLKSRRNAGGS